MIKIKNNTASREPIPTFLFGLLPESLADLSWTDPALGVQDCAWWPEEDISPVLGEYERHGAETLTIDTNRKVVKVSKTAVPWEPSEITSHLSSLKAVKNSQINAWRAQANQSTFIHLGKVIACDALSRSDIDAVAGNIALTGNFPEGFPGAWKATDNTYLLLPDVAAFKALYASMTWAGTSNFSKAQDLKAALASASTKEEIDAIVWG